MQLRDLLTDFAAVNILKLLYDRELKNNSIYSIKLSNIIKKFINFQNIDISINNLKRFELINIDSLKEDKIISISAKGKHFMDIFDKLVQITENKKLTENKKNQKSFQIKYNLTPKEKKIMVVLFKLSKEIGDKPVLLQDLTREIYPANGDKNTPTIKRYTTKLAKLNLIEKLEIKSQQHLKLTPTGERTIKEQLVESLIL
jgi:hypothetical protein